MRRPPTIRPASRRSRRSRSRARSSLTPLQKHAGFFDRNGDGKIRPIETYIGLRALGLGPASSFFFAGVINGALGWPTNALFLPTLTIDLANIQRGKHGSDTDVYDVNGNFDEAKFNRLFATWDKNHDGALDLGELAARTWGERDLFDFVGVIASGGEFGLLWVVANQGGKISKARMRGLYDGSLFYEIEASRK
jgi:peroxygenase